MTFWFINVPSLQQGPGTHYTPSSVHGASELKKQKRGQSPPPSRGRWGPDLSPPGLSPRRPPETCSPAVYRPSFNHLPHPTALKHCSLLPQPVSPLLHCAFRPSPPPISLLMGTLPEAGGDGRTDGELRIGIWRAPASWGSQDPGLPPHLQPGALWKRVARAPRERAGGRSGEERMHNK